MSDIKINITGYSNVKFLGQGAHSKVYTGDQTVIIKETSKENSESEVNILKHIQSQCEKCFPCLIETKIHKDKYLIITKYKGEYYSLQEYIFFEGQYLSKLKNNVIYISDKFTMLSDDQKYKLIENLIDCFNQLQQLKIIHGDIKPGNIIFNPKSLDVNFIDFATSFLIDDKKHKLSGTPTFYSPEIANKSEITSEEGMRGDHWALGATLVMFLTGKSIVYYINQEKDLKIDKLNIDKKFKSIISKYLL